MQEIQIKHKDHAIGKVPLSEGIRVRTKWGWTAKVQNINQEQFKHGQGVTVKREYDDKLFSILPTDIYLAC